MTTYYLDDGGSNTSPYDTAAKAANAWATIAALVGVGDVVKIEVTSVEDSAGSDFNMEGLNTNAGVTYVRVDTTDSDSYDNTTATYNFTTSGGNFEIDLNAGGLFNGLRFSSVEKIAVGSDNDAPQLYKDCWFKLGVSDSLMFAFACSFIDCTIETADTGTSPVPIFSTNSLLNIGTIRNLTCGSGTEHRSVIGSVVGDFEIVGSDFSAMTTNPTYLNGSNVHGVMRLIDCKLPPNYVAFQGTSDTMRRVVLIRCNDTDQIEAHADNGAHVSEATIIRTGGANKSWECTTNAECVTGNTFHTEWMYGIADAAESKTFDIHFAYSGTRLTEEEIFMELEFMDSASTPYGTMVSSQKKALLGDSVGNPNTASETWGGSETYEEYLRITETVGVANSLVRARICIEKTSQTDEVYIDPYLVIS